MKQRRRMLLCVTATSIAAVVGCAESAQPVGMVGPHHPDTEATPPPDAGNVAPETPSVGTTAQAPDKK